MIKANIRIKSNIYPICARDYQPPLEGWYIPEEGNEAYFQQISDIEAYKTACDSCACACAGCFNKRDTSEKPWGRVRINGRLTDICKCQHKACIRFYQQCRPELRETNG